MNLDKLTKELLDKKANENNTIDLNAYAMGMADLKKQLMLGGVGISLPKVCKGCGSLSTKVIDKKYISCCPDSNYIPMEDYCKNSIYPEKQF